MAKPAEAKCLISQRSCIKIYHLSQTRLLINDTNSRRDRSDPFTPSHLFGFGLSKNAFPNTQQAYQQCSFTKVCLALRVCFDEAHAVFASELT